MKNSRISLDKAIGVSFLAISLLASCSEEERVINPLAPEEGITLTVYIPDASPYSDFGMTRADLTESELISAKEGTVQNMYLVLFSGEEEARENRTLTLTKSTDNDAVLNTTGWKSYTTDGAIPKNLEYTCYAVANFERYVSKGSASSFAEYLQTLSEDEVKALALNFSGQLAENTVLRQTELPMAALPATISAESDVADNSEGTVTISDQNRELYVRLSFLCAKVRYTILFDRTQASNGVAAGFSSTFPSNNVKFNSAPTVSGICLKTAWDNSESGLTYTGTGTGNLSPVAYPASDTRYLDSSIETAPANLSTTDPWAEGADKRAWQGIVYLPENKSKENKTMLEFTPAANTMLKSKYSIALYWDSSDDYWTNGATSTAHGLERGAMYDVVARLEQSESFSVTVNIRVNLWEYQSSVSSW